MKLSVRAFLLSISMTVMAALPGKGMAQTDFLPADGGKATFACQIEMAKGYVSGTCIMVREGNVIKGSIFNEFGISAMDFSYDADREKVKLHSVIGMLDRWYIRRVLKKDLRLVVQQLKQGKSEYENEKRHIKYSFVPTVNETEDGDQ